MVEGVPILAARCRFVPVGRWLFLGEGGKVRVTVLAARCKSCSLHAKAWRGGEEVWARR